MALLGDEARKIPGSYKSGTGTITSVSKATAYARPDQSDYGREVYIHGGLSDKSCLYKLDTKYKAGDRVSFTYVPAANPERGCKWAVINLSKIEDGASAKTGNGEDTNHEDDDGRSTTSSQGGMVYTGRATGVIRQATGRIDYNGIGFAYIQLDPPVGGRAFMADRSVTGNFIDENGHFSLAKAFPVGTRVTCDLYPQPERKGCKFFARKVVSDQQLADQEQIEPMPSKLLYTPPRLPVTKQECSPTRPTVSPSKMAMALQQAVSSLSMNGVNDQLSPDIVENAAGTSDSWRPSFKATSDANIQTEPSIESVLLQKIFNDEEIFRLICSRQPDVMFRYMRSGFAPAGIGK